MLGRQHPSMETTPSVHVAMAAPVRCRHPSPHRITDAAQTAPGTHLFDTFFLASRSRRRTSFTPSSRSVTRSPILAPLPLRRSLHQLVKVFCWIVIQVLSEPAISEAPPVEECGERADMTHGLLDVTGFGRDEGQDRTGCALDVLGVLTVTSC